MKKVAASRKIRNAYDEYVGEGEAHPIDTTVEAMIPKDGAQRIKRVLEKIGATSGIDRRLVLELEEAWTSQQAERETVVFNVGHALGVTAGATLSTTSQAKSEARALSQAIRPMVRLSGLSPIGAAAVLVEIVYAILIDTDRSRPTRTRSR